MENAEEQLYGLMIRAEQNVILPIYKCYIEQ